MKNPDFVGRWDDKLEQITVVVSGSLTNVPASLRPGLGVDAARTLASLYTQQGNGAFGLIDGAFCAVGARLAARR